MAKKSRLLKLFAMNYLALFHIAHHYQIKRKKGYIEIRSSRFINKMEESVNDNVV